MRAGKIDRYPSSPAERRELLAWVAQEALGLDEVVTEKELNDRLREFSDDHVMLRRHLVDFSLVERTRSGSSYSRIAVGDEDPAHLTP